MGEPADPADPAILADVPPPPGGGAAAVPVRFALTPAHGEGHVIDYDSKEGIEIYKRGVLSL